MIEVAIIDNDGTTVTAMMVFPDLERAARLAWDNNVSLLFAS